VAKWLAEKAEIFAQKTGHLGIYVLLSIPLMSDTLPIALYFQFDKERKAHARNLFLGANFFAAISRVAILAGPFILGVDLICVTGPIPLSRSWEWRTPCSSSRPSSARQSSLTRLSAGRQR
jgi:hypothetical protein